MRLQILLTNHNWIELNDVAHFIYGNQELTYTQNEKIYTLNNVVTFSSSDSTDAEDYKHD